MIENWKQILFISRSINNMLWYIDFDANIHVCKNKNFIHSFVSHIDFVLMTNKIRFVILKKKTMKLFFVFSSNDSNDHVLKLSVFYISNSSINLLFVSFLKKQDIYWNIENHIFIHHSKSINYVFFFKTMSYILYNCENIKWLHCQQHRFCH